MKKNDKGLSSNKQLEKNCAPEEERKGPIKRTWTRIKRREPTSPQSDWSIQEKAAESAVRDLEKPVEQLLSDIHEGHEKRHDDLKKPVEKQRDAIDLTLYTLKRVASMMAAVAKSNESLQSRVKNLTIAITILTGVLTIIGIFQLVITYCLFKIA